jgi:hypothetical protein
MARGLVPRKRYTRVEYAASVRRFDTLASQVTDESIAIFPTSGKPFIRRRFDPDVLTSHRAAWAFPLQASEERGDFGGVYRRQSQVATIALTSPFSVHNYDVEALEGYLCK